MDDYALFLQFVEAYPATRRQGGDEVYDAFLQALQKVSAQVLVVALESHKRSAQWRMQDGRFIPGIITWLKRESWRQELPEPKAPSTKEDEARALNRLTPFQQAKRLGLK